MVNLIAWFYLLVHVPEAVACLLAEEESRVFHALLLPALGPLCLVEVFHVLNRERLDALVA